MKLGRTFLISLQKLFLFLKKSKIKISDDQISQGYKISEHKKGNTFY